MRKGKVEIIKDLSKDIDDGVVDDLIFGSDDLVNMGMYGSS